MSGANGVGADEYFKRSVQHRPQTLKDIREAAQRLLAQGYNDHGVAAALGIAVEQVRRLIGECGACE